MADFVVPVIEIVLPEALLLDEQLETENKTGISIVAIVP